MLLQSSCPGGFAAAGDSAIQSKHMERRALDFNLKHQMELFPTSFRFISGVPSVRKKINYRRCLYLGR